MTAKTRAPKTALHACECSNWEFGQFVVDGDDDYGTGCGQMTNRVFAQGHDAKLVGFMVRAELAGDEIRRGSHHFANAVHAAGSVSEALALKAQAQLDAAHARVAKKELKAATKTARQSAKKAEAAEAAPVAAPEPEIVKAKVGRWTYEGAIGPVTRDFAYRNKLGQMKSVPEGKYTLV